MGTSPNTADKHLLAVTRLQMIAHTLGTRFNFEIEGIDPASNLHFHLFLQRSGVNEKVKLYTIAPLYGHKFFLG